MKSTRKELFRLQLISQNNKLGSISYRGENCEHTCDEFYCIWKIKKEEFQIQLRALCYVPECISNLRRHIYAP